MLDGEWGDKDRKLTLAYSMYKDGLCSCGHPAVIAHDDEHDGWIVAKSDVVCHVCAALEGKREKDNIEPGQKIYAVDERSVTDPTKNQPQP